MSLYTVTVGQAAAIFPFEESQAVSVYNRGPATVYLSDQSSVSTTTGLKVPPLGSVVWDAGRKMYAICGPIQSQYNVYGSLATLDIQPLESLVLSPQAGMFDFLYGLDPSLISGYRFEVSAYNTLYIAFDMKFDNTLQPTVGTWFSLIVSWYDANGNFIETYSYDSAVDGKGDLYYYIPVRGTYMSINASDNNLGPHFVWTTGVVFGTTRNMPTKNINTHLPWSTSTPIATLVTYQDTIIIPDWQFENIYLPTLGNYITASFRASTAVNTAGGFRICSIRSGRYMFGNDVALPISATGGSVVALVTNVPYSQSPILTLGQGGAPVLAGAGSLDVTLTYRDV